MGRRLRRDRLRRPPPGREHISWYEAERFAALCWARMPGEDEFEYAARAKSPGERWFDGHEPTDLQGYESLRDLAFRDGGAQLPWNDGFPEHAPVGTFRPKSFGLFDVGGNVNLFGGSTDACPPAGTK